METAAARRGPPAPSLSSIPPSPYKEQPMTFGQKVRRHAWHYRKLILAVLLVAIVVLDTGGLQNTAQTFTALYEKVFTRVVAIAEFATPGIWTIGKFVWAGLLCLWLPSFVVKYGDQLAKKFVNRRFDRHYRDD